MKKFVMIVFFIVVVLVGMFFYSSDKSENIEGDGIDLNEGQYFDEIGSLLGTCEFWADYESGNSGPRTDFQRFYDEDNNLIGECWHYFGPGSSGGTGIGCDSDDLLGEPIECDGCVNEGKRLPKYSCVTD
jgi:hypothetical protein